MTRNNESVRARWARLRFSIIGPLLAAPPEEGQLQQELAKLAAKTYRHPTTGEAHRFGASTIERWYYLAKNHPDDPIGALGRKVPSHTGTHPSIPVALRQALRAQHKEHSTWSYQLHHDNLVALTEQWPQLGKAPSYSTTTRFMKAQGLFKQRGKRRGKRIHSSSFEAREVRSFEAEHVHALWHADYHIGSRHVLLPSGKWAPCHLLGFLDDRSRLCCHLQWYLQQTAETFVHGLVQAILKRGLPRSLLTDNGSPMMAAETTEGLLRRSITHYTTLPYTPEQNAKQENFWGQIEGRLLPMLESEKALTLPLLNHATQAWVELEYHRTPHSELADTPLNVALQASNVGRPAPDSETLRHTFRKEERRTQRRSDGTITVGGVRFELPSRYRALLRPTVRFARWDLSTIDLVDPRHDTILCQLYPLDKRKNADRKRRPLEPLALADEPAPESVQESDEFAMAGGIAPLLQNMMARYAATGLPPAYLSFVSAADAAEQETDSVPVRAPSHALEHEPIDEETSS